MARPAPDVPSAEELPAYLSEPVAERGWELSHLREGLARARQMAAASPDSADYVTVPFRAPTPTLAPVFLHLVPLRRARLAGALDAWWAAGARSGVVTVQRRHQLGRPQGDTGMGWTIKGRVRRLTSLHWVPVVVELAPLYEDFTMMRMTPQVHVFASQRYFRIGHSVLDRLWADLAALSAGPDP